MALFSGHTPISTTHDITSTPYYGLTAAELMEKGVCPLKRIYFKPKIEQQVNAPDSSNGGQDIENKTQEKQAQDKPLSRNQAKKQLRKALVNKNAEQLCHNFLLGLCNFGSSCKFGHNIEDFLRSKPKDLLGECPFTPVSSCPYGICCRFASSHFFDKSDIQAQLVDILAANNKAEVNAAETGKEAEVDAPSSKSYMAYPEAMATEGHLLAVSPPRVGSAEEATDETSVPEVPIKLFPYDENTILQYLRLSPEIEKSTNTLPKEVQQKLWKNRYDFSKADGILKELGCRITFKRGRDDSGAGAKAHPAAAKRRQEDDTTVPVTVTANAAAADGNSTSAAVDNSAATEVAPAPSPAPGSDAAVIAALVSEEETSAKKQETEKEEEEEKVEKADEKAVGISNAAESEAKSPPPPRALDPDSAQAMHVETLLRPEEKRSVDFRGKTYLAPLTTVGNLPFRRVCKQLGVDITCGEMAMATNLLQGQQSEWALLKRHPSEDVFGVQICGGFPDAVARCGQLIDESMDVSFVDVNMGCPIDLVCDKDAGSALLRKPRRIEEIVRAMSRSMDAPMTIKIRRGFSDGVDVAHTLLPNVRSWGAIAVTIHGRSRQQRYTKLADWDYAKQCSLVCPDLQLMGNGDVMSYLDWNSNLEGSKLAGCMIGRGALIKPWIFTEIKEQRHWDIRSGERLDILRSFVGAGLEHWGSDAKGVANTRRFLMEWLSFTCRYVPVGLLEVLPQKMNHRPLPFYGRDDLETLMARPDEEAWAQIANMLLGPPPAGQEAFAPKHKSNAYAPLEDAVRG